MLLVPGEGDANEEDGREERERRIRRAIEEPEALGFEYQAIFELESGRAVGAEALARFSLEPPRPPDAWFAEAESVGVRTSLELAAARLALPALAVLPSALYISLNASPGLVESPDFEAALPTEAMDRVVVEVSGNTSSGDDALAEACARIQARGGRIAVDDAGRAPADDVGPESASLQRIRRLRPDIVKIDRSLTAGIERHEGARSVARSLIELAGAMGSAVLAEGIEGPLELEALRGLGVALGQGYYLARPLPLAELARSVRAAT